MRPWIKAFILLSAVCAAGCEPDSIKPVPERDFQWYLPTFLNEASGLALNDHYLLVHDDETAHVYAISKALHEVSLRVQLGDPVMVEDLEGIATNGDDLYLMNSEGHIFLAESALDGEETVRPNFTTYKTGLGDYCQLEGLAYYDGLLLIPCKLPRSDYFKDQLTVFSFDPETGISEEFFRILMEDAGRGFELTSITYSGDDFYLLAARYLIIINPVTSVSRIIPLAPTVHRQPEGIEITPEGEIYIVDDFRKGIGRITRYTDLQALITANAPQPTQQ